MSQKNKVIIGLLAVAVVLFCAIRFWIIPEDQAQQAEFVQNQTDALTHDISSIQNYRSAYVGDASNISGLFEHLPLNDIPKRYEINSNDCILTVYYLDTIWNVGEEKVQRDLVYNSVAAMAAIDNLSEIVYQFSGDSYSFERRDMENIFGGSLSELLSPEKWNDEVQERLTSKDFCQQFYK